MFRILTYIVLIIFIAIRFENVRQNSEIGYREDFEFAKRIHKYSNNVVKKVLPSPHKELLLGMTIGDDGFSNLPTFNDMLRKTGTIHVVVVSGFNISLVYGLLFKIFGSPYKLRNLVFAGIGALVYAGISGFDPPVIRSWIMGSIFTLGKYYGRKIDTLQVLMFSAIIMLLINPLYLISLSFQLSFLATLGLVLFSERISKLMPNNNVLFQDLTATLSAQTLVVPLLMYRFGTLSLISPIVNMLILWTVPLITVLGGLLLILGWIPVIGDILGFACFLPLEFFTFMVEMFSKIPFAQIHI